MAKNAPAAAVAAPERDYQTEADVRNMHETRKIMADKPRHAKAKAMALEMAKAVGSPMDGPTVEGKEKGPPDAEDKAEAKAKK